MKSTPGLLWIALLLSTVFPESGCLKKVELKAPEAVKTGESLQLVCEYDLDGAPLYSVKFYKGEQEFYRFVPKESPPTRIFPLPGLSVNIYLSNSSVVTLSNVHSNMTSFYGCEVSADAPLFHTIIQSAPVIVTEDPLVGPEVAVEKNKYALGEKIKANCTTTGGFPPANITWYINGNQIKDWEGNLITYDEDRGSSELEFEARTTLFQRGKLKLRCEATQFMLYRRVAETVLAEDTPRLARVLGPTPYLPLESYNGTAVGYKLNWTWLSLSSVFCALVTGR